MALIDTEFQPPSSIVVPLRVPFVFRGVRHEQVTLRMPSKAALRITLQPLEAGLAEKDRGEFQARMIALHTQLPFAAVDEMALDDAALTMKRIGLFYGPAEEECP